MPTTNVANLKKINSYFERAVAEKASDLHLLLDKPPVLRINGELISLDEEPVLNSESIEKLIFSLLDKKKQERFIKEREIDFSYELKGYARFRVNVHYEKHHPSLVARIINTEVPVMEEIGMPEVVYHLTRLHQGLVLITGPTGCGKSTSLAAMINLINQERDTHIITLEDPIEFIFKSDKSYIRQRQLHDDFLSFSGALKHVVRQDPNVIMVGEMRDLETIAAAITIAETGHLVFATLHTLNATQTIDRIVDVFPPYQQEQIRLQLSMELKGVVSQQLIPSIKGGRIAAREILINTPAVSNLIRENKISQMTSVIQTSAEHGMMTMDQDLKRLYENGLISGDVMESYLSRPDALK